MITRPLDLASRLRPEPRNLDFLFYVNVGLIAVFFSMFGSRFILAPGLGIDFKIPEMPGALAAAGTTECVISVLPSGQIFGDGLLNMAQLEVWLKAQAAKAKNPALLVRVSAQVQFSQLADISSVARRAGFARIVVAAEEPPSSFEHASRP